MPATSEPKAAEPLRHKLAQKLFAAVLTAVVTLLALLMPPIVNAQVLKIETTLTKPLMAVVVAFVVLTISA